MRALAVLSTVALMTGGVAGLSSASGQGSDHGHDPRATTVFSLAPSATGENPEGVAWDHRGKAFFTGIVSTGVIYRGTLGDPTVHPYITPAAAPAGNSAVGMKVSHGKLYVAGGPTGSIYVYDVATGALQARFETGTGGFLNDLVVTANGDVYATDSFRASLWHVTPAMLAAGAGTPTAVGVTPEVTIIPGTGVFNLNGIVSRHGGRELIVVNSSTGSLYRIDIDPGNTAARTITKIEAPTLAGGDGMIRDRGRLVVVIGNPASLSFLKLKHHDSRARLDSVRTDPTLRGPSTLARARHLYLVVNASFGSPAPYTVSGLSRRGGHH